MTVQWIPSSGSIEITRTVRGGVQRVSPDMAKDKPSQRTADSTTASNGEEVLDRRAHDEPQAAQRQARDAEHLRQHTATREEPASGD